MAYKWIELTSTAEGEKFLLRTDRIYAFTFPSKEERDFHGDTKNKIGCIVHIDEPSMVDPRLNNSVCIIETIDEVAKILGDHFFYNGQARLASGPRPLDTVSEVLRRETKDGVTSHSSHPSKNP